MNQKIDISIRNPCSEKFKNFKPAKNGRFCNSCQKIVVDFTKMSDSEILNYFKDRNDKTCGYFNKTQIKIYENPSIENRKFNFIGLMSFSLLSLFSIQNNWAQEKETKNTIHITENNSNYKKETNKNLQNLLKGTIFDGLGPISDISITLKNSIIATVTDFDGNFTFPQILNTEDILIISHVSYETQEIKISNINTHKQLRVILNLNSCELLGEVAVKNIYVSKPSFFQRIKNLFR